MLFNNITIVDENFEVNTNMYVGVKDGYIKYISKNKPKEDYGEIYEGAGKLLLPAFYNAHSHLPMVYMRGYGENLSLMDWLNGKIFPFEAKLTADDIYYGCMLGVAEMLRFGIASVSEMYIKQDPLGRAFVDSGVKANFCLSTLCFGDEDYKDLHFYTEAMDAMKKYNGLDNDRIKTELCLHAEYTTTEKVAMGIAQVAMDNNTTFSVHVSETEAEVEDCKKRHENRSPVKYFHDCGVFKVHATAAHCVHIDDEDIAILKEDGVTVASCPKSNLKLSSGICPVTKLLDAGVNVAIGTDSVASNNNLNMIEEMRFFSLLAKAVTKDPTVITPAKALYCATRAGAIAQNRNDCGLIKEGYKADLTVLDIDRIYMKPEYNMLNNLIYSAQGNDVCLTMVDGKVLYKDGIYTTLDIEKLNYEVETRRNRILSEL